MKHIYNLKKNWMKIVDSLLYSQIYSRHLDYSLLCYKRLEKKKKGLLVT